MCPRFWGGDRAGTGHRGAFLPRAVLGRKESKRLPPGLPLPAWSPGAFVLLPRELWHLRDCGQGRGDAGLGCSSRSISPGTRAGKSGGTPVPWLFSVGKVGQLSQALPCSFQRSQLVSSSFLLTLPSPAPPTGSSNAAEPPDFTAPPLSWAWLVPPRAAVGSHGAKVGQGRGTGSSQPGDGPFTR